MTIKWSRETNKIDIDRGGVLNDKITGKPWYKKEVKVVFAKLRMV